MSPSARRLGVLLVTAWILVGVGGFAWYLNTLQYGERQENERAVYQAMLNYKGFSGKNIVVSDFTKDYFDPHRLEEYLNEHPDAQSRDRYGWFRKTYPALQATTLENAEMADQQPQSFPTDLWINALSSYHTESTDTPYYDRDITLSFSRIGFNPNFTQALVYLRYSCGTRCGGADAYFFEKAAGRWTLITRQLIEIS